MMVEVRVGVRGVRGGAQAIDVKFDAATDPGILARAEWLKFLSLFFNAEATANAKFDEEVAEIDAVTALAGSTVVRTKSRAILALLVRKIPLPCTILPSPIPASTRRQV
jgi:hypothetical protein